MFTGIIEAVGNVQKITPLGGDVRLTIHSDNLDFSDVKLGDSIASNGICLTVVAIGGNAYSVDVSRETLGKTTMGCWQVGDVVNLEKAMLPTTRFGGHMVAGHVDTAARVVVFKRDARSIYVELALPTNLRRYTAIKGSITVDGVSLTTNALTTDGVALNIVPHTAVCTNIGKHWRVGALVNVEVDLMARYLERLIGNRLQGAQAQTGGITAQFLAENGFD